MNPNEKSVTIYAKDYGMQLRKLAFFGITAKNDSDMMTDYFETDRIKIYEGDHEYKAARAAAEKKATAQRASFEKRFPIRKNRII
jgi:hypothetical protein